MSMKHEINIETIKSAPALVGVTITALTLNEWVAVATLVYVVLQIIYLIWKWYKEYR